MASFSANKTAVDGKQTTCSLCQKEYRKKNSAKIALQNRALDLKKKYGLSLADYDELLKSQKGLCAICEISAEESTTTFHVDHDWTTGQIRGLLCLACNTKLGVLENLPWKTKAELYLKARGKKKRAAIRFELEAGSLHDDPTRPFDTSSR